MSVIIFNSTPWKEYSAATEEKNSIVDKQTNKQKQVFFLISNHGKPTFERNQVKLRHDARNNNCLDPFVALGSTTNDQQLTELEQSGPTILNLGSFLAVNKTDPNFTKASSLLPKVNEAHEVISDKSCA